MKLFNKFFLLFAAASLLFVACDDEEDFTPGDPDLDGCYKVYFPQDQDVSLSLDPADPTELDIIVRRENTDGAITVPVEIDDEAGVFNVPDISFASGVDSCVVHVTFDDADVGVTYTCTIDVTDPMYSSVYSDKVSSLTITVVRERWISLGMAEYCDWWFFYNTNADTQLGGYMVELLQNESSPSKFRLVEPYKEGLENPDEGYGGPGTYQPETDNTYMSFQIMSPGNTLSGTTVSQTGLIYFSDYDTGWHYDYYDDQVYILHPARFTNYSSESYWLCNAVQSYQDDGTTPALVQLAPYYYMWNTGGWNYTQYDEVIWIIFPGVVLDDYSVEVEYLGRDDDYNVTASVTLGADVASARVAMVEGDGVSAAATAIQRGTVDYTEITEDGVVSFFCDEGGTYSIVAVTYDEEGVAQEYGYDTFRLSSPTETWTLYGVGDYEYSKCYSGSDPGLELYQSDVDPTRFKIEHWLYDVDFCFTWDQDTNEILVDDQITGDTYGNYGPIYIDDLYDYYGLGTSTYNNGIFYFAVIYYCTGGYFGRGYETFTLEGSSFTPSVEALAGQYYVGEISYYGYSYYDVNYWTFEASDDSSKGNVMMTQFDSFSADKGSYIYGNLDTTTGVFSIPDWQYFRNYSNMYDMYFSGMTGEDIEFQLVGEGVFEGPTSEDYVGLYLCDHSVGDEDDYDYYLGWNNLYTVVFGSTDDGMRYQSASPASVGSLSASNKKLAPISKERGTVAKDNNKIVTTLEFVKPAIAAKPASVEQQTPTKLDKSEMRSHKSVPVNIKVREN